MIKILIGGSPCTYWSVAQKKGREVEAEGLGWELFRNYLIAKEKFKPDFFLYENNKSAAQPIKDQISNQNGEDLPVYEVVNGEIEIKGKKYPIKLPDGHYVIRKLTPTECERLQTLPDGYTSAVSATQRYRGLGNGWTAEVIIHILAGALKDVPRDEEIVVLSMYDGIGTGRYCLDKMGFTNVTYYAYEIDKPAMTVALSNYPNIIQLGDAFDLRRDDWELGKRFERTAEQKAEAPESPDQTTDLSDAPEEIKEQIIENDRALKEKDSTAPAPPPEGFDVVDQLSELLAERKKLHIIDEENLRYNCDIIALEYAIGALRR